MTPLQIAKQLQYLLRQRQWEGNVSYEKVFFATAIAISPIAVDSWLASKPFPGCLINIGSAANDQQAPAYLDQSFDLILIGGNPGDEDGEYAITGGGRGRGIGSSSGRGLGEFEPELWATIQLLTQQNGIQVQGFMPTAVAAQIVAQLGFIASRQYTFRALCTTNRTYPGVTALVGSGASGGAISLTWAIAPTQWMSVSGSGGQVVRYAAGSTAPATPTSGTSGGVITGAATSASITGLASGTYSVSIFTGYAEYDPATPTVDRYSDPVSVTVVVP